MAWPVGDHPGESVVLTAPFPSQVTVAASGSSWKQWGGGRGVGAGRQSFGGRGVPSSLAGVRAAGSAPGGLSSVPGTVSVGAADDGRRLPLGSGRVQQRAAEEPNHPRVADRLIRAIVGPGFLGSPERGAGG